MVDRGKAGWLAVVVATACGGEGDVGGDPPLESRIGPGGACEPVDVEPRRAIFETHVDVLQPFTLRSVLHHAAKNAGYATQPVQTYRRLIDTYATGAEGRFPNGQHCDDALPDPRFTDPDLPCGLLGCDAEFFCGAHDTACFVCRGDGSACEPNHGLDPGVHEVCGFNDGSELCSFDGRRITDCVPVTGDECDDAGCDPLGCDAIQMCDPTFELCITCSEELDACRIDQGIADEPVEAMCNGVDMCDFDVAAQTVSGCEPDPVCEEAQCGPLGCEQRFFCTPDFNACFACSGDGQECDLEGQSVPSPTQVCDLNDDDSVCTFADGVIESCQLDEEGVCFGIGGGDTDEGGEVTTNATTATSAGFIVSAEESSFVGGEDEGIPTSTAGTVSVGSGGFIGDDSASATATSGGFIGDDSVGDSTLDSGGFIGDETTGSFDDGGDATEGDDDGGDGGDADFGAINGYPLECPRIEAQQIDNVDEWFPIAISNRFDLAPEDGSNCGQQRIVFGNNAQNRMLMIFEAQIPNPEPGCGLAACRPVVEFWANLDGITDLQQRKRQLKKAFLTGHPVLEAAGFGPFVDARHYAFGTGQVRTNNFDQDPWTLREYKLVERPRTAQLSQLRVAQVPVTYSPNGDHFNDAIDTLNGAECRENFLVAMEGLLTDEPNAMSFPIAPECRAAESRDDGISDFAQQLVLGTGAFEAAIEARLDELGSPLSAIDIANRARFAGACIGCHQQSNGADLGNGVTAPSSAGFTHVVEFFADSCSDGDPAQCFQISDGLERSFLPHRELVMEQFLAVTPCEGACEGPVYPIAIDGPIDVRQALLPDGEVDTNTMLLLERRRRERGALRTVGGGSTHSAH